MSPAEYETFSAEIHAAGFFTTPLYQHGGFRKATVCSKRVGGRWYTGNSFWVSRVNGQVYLGTMGYEVYRLRDDSRLVELCIDWLTRVPDETQHFFDEQLVRDFDLVHLDEGEGQRIIDEAVASDETKDRA